MSCVSETCEKYKVASGPSPVEHLELYIWLNLDELGFERPKRVMTQGGSEMMSSRFWTPYTSLILSSSGIRLQEKN